MPPKKSTRSKGTTKEPTIKMLKSNPSINKIIDEIGTAHDNAAGAVFQELMANISDIIVQRTDGKHSAESIQAEIFGDFSQNVAMMISRHPIASPIRSHSIRTTRTAPLRQPKSEIVSEESDAENEDPAALISPRHETSAQVEPASKPPTVQQPCPTQEPAVLLEARETEENPLSHHMEVDSTPTSSPTIATTPPIGRELTDEEFQKVLPNTVQRMQQLSISRKPITMTTSTPLATPRRNPTREAALHKNVFHTPVRQPIPSAPVAPRTPARQLLQSQAEKPVDKKQKHADDLRERIIAEKKEKCRREEEKRIAVMERKREQERIRMEKNEEIRRRDEQRAAFARQQKETRSPSRHRLAPEARTPSAKSHSSRKVFPVKEEQAPTPGRGHAKRVRMEVVGGKKTVAQPTGALSPSRHLTRSATRHQTQPIPMQLEEHEDLTPPVRSKHKVKAKRSVKTEIPSPVATQPTTSSTAAQEALFAEQERYLLEAAAADRARIAQAEEAKRLEKERLEAERVRQQKEEMARLEEIQREEEQRLREQREREEAELQATLARQAEKKALAEKLGKTPPAKATAYEITPPRTYQAKSKNDYGLNDLNSDDETDQEDDPRKEVPAWADFAVVRDHVRRQIAAPPCNFELFFGEIAKPVLRTIFGETVRAKKRGSSAVWKSSPANTSVHRNPLRDIPE